MPTNADDRNAIFDAVAAYSAAANRLDGRGMEAPLLPNCRLAGVAKLAGLEDKVIEGARAIGDMFAGAFSAMEFVHQVPQILALRIDGNTAQATTSVVEYIRPKGAGIMLLIGNYQDTLQRTADGWRFSSRTLEVKSFAPLNAP